MGMGMLTGLNLCIPIGHHWKILFALGFVPLILNFISLLLLPESPMYYIFIKDDKRALEVLKQCLKEKDAKKYLKKLKYEKYFILDYIPHLLHLQDLYKVFVLVLKVKSFKNHCSSFID